MSEALEEIASQIKEIICDDIGIDFEEIQDSTLLLSSGLVDSFTFVSVVTFIESDYNIEFSQEELVLENFDTINAIKMVLESKKISVLET